MRTITRRRNIALVAGTLLLVLAAGGLLTYSRGDDAERKPRPDAEPPATRAPAPDQPIPRDPDRLAREVGRTDRRLDAAVDRWLDGETARGPAPRDLALLALYQQRLYLLLTPRKQLQRATLGRLRGSVRAQATDILAARRSLQVLNPPTRQRRFATGPALPAGVLLRLYRRAERRFDVDWRVLAAVNLVETGFNRIRSNSTAGAQGPMQFIPSTWSAYGMGGDIRDPEDAIMGAANYLRASGAPRDHRRALFAYNPSSLYVTAVSRYARRMRRDRRAFYVLYNWQIFVRTPMGQRRLTGPRPLR